MSVRKRSNSLIPVEFRNDTSDGGMERAALATVFGVREYTESKIFWNTEEDEDFTASSTPTSGFRPVQRNASKKSYTSIKSNTMVIQSPHQEQQQSLRALPHQQSLPTIPIVSEFGDLWPEVERKKQEHIQIKRAEPSDELITLPADLSDYPFTLFDLVESDDDPNIILWGTRQQTTVPVNAPSSENDKQHRQYQRVKWTSPQHILTSSLKLKKKSSSVQTLSSQEEPVFQVIEAATIEKLVEKLTISLDYTFMTDFFLIFRVFMTPLQLCKLLILRFKWSLEENEEKRCVVRIRTFVVMRHWLLNYFLHDFVPSKDLRIQSPRDQRIIKGLKRVVRRLKKVYYASSSSKRVQVIGPPPPTYAQEKVNAMVKEKLAHNSIRQKTLDIVTGVHVDARHSSNTAVRDKDAPLVVVIGNYPPSSSSKAASSFSEGHRRRGSSVSSCVSNPPMNNSGINSPTSHNMYSLDDSNNSATKEWNNIKQKEQTTPNKNPDMSASHITDDSLESLISPGTSDVSEYEDDDEDDDEDDEDSDDDSLSQASLRSRHEDYNNYLPDESLADQSEKALFEQGQHESSSTRPKSFYRAQLAIPSASSTPEISYMSQSNINQVQAKPNSSISSESKKAANTSFIRSFSEPKGMHSTYQQQQHQSHEKLMQQQPMGTNSLGKARPFRRLDRKTKPLPPISTTSPPNSEIEDSTLLTSSIISYAKPKQSPGTPSSDTWKINSPINQNRPSEKIPRDDEQPIKHIESNFSTQTTPKSRIMEIDLDNNQSSYGSLMSPPPLPTHLQTHERRSIVLSISTSMMAKEFCLIEKAILHDINWEELVDCRWTKMPASSLYRPQSSSYDCELEHDMPPGYFQQGIFSRKKRMKQQYERNNNVTERGIEKAINRFNAVCQWVSSEIVQTKQLDQRVKLIEKFIRLAKKCKDYCNFSTLLQILLGLQSSSVSRLERTWGLVSKREMKTLQELSTFTSPTKNWKHIRDSMSKVAEEYGESPTEIQVEVDSSIYGKRKKSSMTIKLPFGGCIPFLGIYLSDLVFNAELPSYLPSPNQDIKRSNQTELESVVLSQPLVHFRKHRITATVIKRVLVFKSLANRYSFDPSLDVTLYNTCLQVPALDMDTIQKLSREIEP
ncbi:ras guanine nucleotide exchange factor domain-containing protein [Blakeslea trispora]|nr:ras guanine nucleotide exchange factor domain-containing protein [Blakeslea trispora]